MGARRPRPATRASRHALQRGMPSPRPETASARATTDVVGKTTDRSVSKPVRSRETRAPQRFQRFVRSMPHGRVAARPY